MNFKFILRADQQRNGLLPLYCRGYFGTKKKDISLKIYLTKGQFDEDKLVIKNHPDQQVLNLNIDKIKFRMSQEILNCQLNETEVTPEMFEGNEEKYLEVKNYCDEYDFRMYVVDKDGKRRQIDPETFGKK